MRPLRSRSSRRQSRRIAASVINGNGFIPEGSEPRRRAVADSISVVLSKSTVRTATRCCLLVAKQAGPAAAGPDVFHLERGLCRKNQAPLANSSLRTLCRPIAAGCIPCDRFNSCRRGVRAEPSDLYFRPSERPLFRTFKVCASREGHVCQERSIPARHDRHIFTAFSLTVPDSSSISPKTQALRWRDRRGADR